MEQISKIPLAMWFGALSAKEKIANEWRSILQQSYGVHVEKPSVLQSVCHQEKVFLNG